MRPGNTEPEDTTLSGATNLRQQAEEVLRGQLAEPAGALSHVEALALVHELQVHQIELELQNEELLRTRRAAEALRDRYADLYDFAPVGYFTLDAAGTIREANLAGAVQLGVDRESLVGARFATFLNFESRYGFAAFCARVLAGSTTETCDVSFAARPGHGAWYAQLRGRADAAGSAAFLRFVVTDFTERRRAEDALRESEAKYRTFFDDDISGNFVSTVDGRILDCNPAFARMFGFPSVEEARSDSVIETYDAPSEREALLDRLRRERRFENDERFRRRRDGTRIHVVENIIGDFDAAGNLVETRGYISDDTKRYLAEEGLRESEERLRLAVDAADAGMWEWDLRTDRNVWSEEIWRLYGLQPHSCEASYDAWRDAIHPEDRDRTERLVQETVAKGAELNFEYRVRDESGGIRWLMSRGRPQRDADGELVRYIGIIIDITERKQAEEALRESEERLRLAQESATVAIWDWNVRTGGLTYSPEFLQIYGFEEDRITTYGEWRAHVHPDDIERVDAERMAVLAHGERYNLEYRIIRPSGEVRWTAATGRGYYDESGNLVRVLGVIIDITERKTAELTLARSAERLQRSNEELQRFAYVASHDLQEPLRSIISFTQLLERRYKGRLGQDADEYIAFIIEGGNRMQQLIEDLLQLSRVETKARALSPTDTAEVVADALRLMETPIREADATIEAGDLPTVMADSAQLVQVFVNLIGNAVKYRRHDVPPRVRVSAERSGGFWRFAVEDNGIGIEPEYFDRIFVIFQRLHTHDKYGGTGIGLAVVRKIVERHGGRIWVESTPGEGSTFLFTLPAA